MHTLLLECTFHFHLALACWLQLPIPLSLLSPLSAPVRVVPLSLFAFSARKSHITLTHSHTHTHTHTKAAAVFIVMPCILPLTHVRALKIPFQQQFQLVILFARGIMALSFNWQPQWQQLCRLPQKLTDIARWERDRETETERNSRVTERERDREGRGTDLHSFTITTIGRCEPLRDKLLATTAAVV